MKKRFIMIGLTLAFLIAIVVIANGQNKSIPDKKPTGMKEVINELTKRVDDLESRISDIEEALLLAEEDEDEDSGVKEEKEKEKPKDQKENDKAK